MILTLPFRPPFDFQGLLDFYARHAIAGLERFEPGRYTRVVAVRGRAGTVSVTLDGPGNGCASNTPIRTRPQSAPF